MDFPFSPQGKNVYVLGGRSYGRVLCKYKHMGFIFLGSKITADGDFSHEI